MRLFPGMLMTLCGLLAALPSAAQTRPPEAVEYRDGQLRGQLPYGEPFVLYGSTRPPGAAERAEVVQIMLYEEADPRRRRRQERRLLGRGRAVAAVYGDEPVFIGSWWAGTDRDPGKFDVYIGRPLWPDTRYKLVFNFFQRHEINDTLTRQIVRDVKEGIYRLNKRSVRVDDVARQLNERVARMTDSLSFGYLRTTPEGEVIFDRGVRELSLPVGGEFAPSVQEDIARLVREEMALRSADSLLRDVRLTLQALARSQPYLQLAARLEDLALDPAVRVPFSMAEVQSLRQVVESGQAAADPFMRLLPFAAADGGALTDPQKRLILELQTYYQELTVNIQTVQRRQAAIVILNERIGPGGLDRIIASGFVLAQSASVVTTPFTQLAEAPEPSGNPPSGAAQRRAAPAEVLSSSTGFDAINIGTAYGVSAVGLNFGRPAGGGSGGFTLADTEPDLITYLGVKFYFSRVDKSLRIADPYPLPRDRFSLLAGIKVSGQLNYRGADLGNVIGVQPVLGLSFDFNRAMSLDAGFIFFEQETLSPLTSYARLRAAPFAGLSIDANAFNAVRKLILSLNP